MYQQLIREILAKEGHLGMDPRHVEGYMRIAHSTLDGLSASQFRAEVRIGVDCIQEGGVEMAERNAQSFGL